jgi:mannose-6-phosphate isomerase-like protein (cupin superfamily)
VTAGGQTADLYRNIAVLMPANLEFTIKSTGDQPLAMYVINEPTPPGFRPNCHAGQGREQAPGYVDGPVSGATLSRRFS